MHMARIGETFGIVLAEAILCGLPVVTHQTPYSEILKQKWWDIYEEDLWQIAMVESLLL